MVDVQRAFLQIPGVSPLLRDDEQLFRVAFSSHQLQYAHSWLYILRAAHVNAGEMGYKYVSNELVAAIGYRHDFIYVTPVFDTTGGMRLHQLCDKLFKATARPVLIKKFQHAVFDQVVPATKIETRKLPLEDDTCPETVLHLQKFFVSSDGEVNPVAKKLIRRARAFENSGLTFDILDDITSVPFEKIERFLAQDPEKYASYLPIIEYLYTQKADPYKYRVMVFMHKNEVRGLYMTELLSLTEVGMYGGITSKDTGGITEWMDIHFFRKLLADGIAVVHLGGAENEGIAEYVRKLFPHRPAYFAQTILYDHGSEWQDVPAHIRSVAESDFNELAVLYRDLYNELDDLGESWTKETAHKFISHFYNRQPDLFFLAEVKGEIVGAIVAAIQPWWDGNHLVEGEVVLDPRYRRTTLNRQLLKKLLTEARVKYNTVAWDTFTPTSHKHPLGAYKQLGFTEVPQWAAITGDIHTVLERLGV